MTEEQLFQEVSEYEVFLRMEEAMKEEPEMDDEGSYIMYPGESDDNGNWYWKKDKDGQWYLSGFNQERFDIFVNDAVKQYEEKLRKKYHIGDKAKWH